MLEKNELPSACWHYPPTEVIIQVTHFQVQPSWVLLSCSVLQNKPLWAGQVFLAFCLHMPLPLASAFSLIAMPFLTLSLVKFPFTQDPSI